MNDEHVLKGAFEGMKFGPGKYGQLCAAQTADQTMTRVHSNKYHVSDLALVSKENKRCTSQHTRITIVILVHRRLLLP